jgi:2-polyprenyl-3-methyl-5-hydroxy-6-metoxy-1,4-benzoquinol methylase
MITFPVTARDIEHFDKCLVCHSENIELISNVATQDGTVYLATSLCNTCGHVFRNSRPTEAWFMDAFDLRHAEQQAAGINPINPVIEEDRFRRYHAIGSYFRKAYPEVKRALDVGCGPGSGLKAWEEVGLTAKGVDADESRASYALKLGLDVFVGNWQDFHTEELFDVITCVHSLEHFYDPEIFLKEIARLAKEDGLLYVEVPDTLDHVKDWNDSLYLAHNSNFNAYSLALLAASNGWEPLERVNPYAGTGLHEGHLAMVFRKKTSQPASANPLLDENLVAGYGEKIKTLYRNLLPSNLPHHFVISAINDLSLSYKSNVEVKRTVDDNYQGRQITVAENRIHVY